jgi:hypothetical protein
MKIRTPIDTVVRRLSCADTRRDTDGRWPPGLRDPQSAVGRFFLPGPLYLVPLSPIVWPR